MKFLKNFLKRQFLQPEYIQKYYTSLQFCTSIPNQTYIENSQFQALSEALENNNFWSQQEWKQIRDSKEIQINLLQELLKQQKNSCTDRSAQYSQELDNLCKILLHENGVQLLPSDVSALTYLCSNFEEGGRLLEGLAFFANKLAYDFNPKQIAIILQAHAASKFQFESLHKRLGNATIYRMNEASVEDVAQILGALGDLKVECIDLQDIASEWCRYQIQEISGEDLLELLWGILWNQQQNQDLNIPWIKNVVQSLPNQFDNQHNVGRLKQVVDLAYKLELVVNQSNSSSN